MVKEEVTITPRQVISMHGYSSHRKLWQKYELASRKNYNTWQKQRAEEAKTGVIVKGKRDVYWKLTGAIVRGELDERKLLAIDVADLEELDRDGTFTAYVLAPEWESASFDELLGEVRACFDGAPTSEKWTRLIEVLDACCPDDLDRLLANVEPRLKAWLSREALPTWEPPAKRHPFMQFVHRDWALGVLDGALLTAPPHWIFEMCRGEYSPKHRIVRSLALEYMNINWGVMKKIMANPHLIHLTSFNVGGNPVVGTKAFYKSFRTWEAMRKVERLRLYAITSSFGACVEGMKGASHTFDALKEVNVHVSSHYMDLNPYQGIEAYPCFANASLNYEETSASVYEYIS